VFVAFIAILVLLLIWLQFWVVLRSQRPLLLSLDEDLKAEHEAFGHAEDDDGGADEDSKKKKDGEAKGDAGETKVQRMKSKKSLNKQAEGEEKKKDSRDGQDSEEEGEGDSGSEGEGDEEKETFETEKKLEDEIYKHDPDTDKMTIHGPPSPKANFTYKLKIFLGFMQVVTNLASGLEIQWPGTYKTFLTYFDVVNFDFIFSSVTSSDCFSEITYYRKYLVIALAPVAVAILVIIFYLLPKYFELCCFRHMSLSERQRSQMRFYCLFLYSLFLIYPGVSSTVLRLYSARKLMMCNISGLIYELSATLISGIPTL